jgi:hypothetical protein
MEINNNNPGNIRKVASYKWVGEQDTAVGQFVKFDTLINGYRAMIKDIQNKIKSGNNTIYKIIYKWAPPSDNNPTEDYIDFVSKKTNIDKNQILKFDDIDTIGNIALNMSFLEHGVKGDTTFLQNAVNEAKSLFSGGIKIVKQQASQIGLLIGIALISYFLVNKK